MFLFCGRCEPLFEKDVESRNCRLDGGSGWYERNFTEAIHLCYIFLIVYVISFSPRM